MRVRLLGPVDVVADGAVRPVTGLRRKAVLAVLALQHGDVVARTSSPTRSGAMLRPRHR